MPPLADDRTSKRPRSGPVQIPVTPDRIVKPRRTTAKPLPVIAVGASDFLSESGETGTIAELVDLLPKCEATLLCTVGAADFLAMLTSIYLLRTPTTWQWRARASERNICMPTKEIKVVKADVAVQYFGWQGKSGGQSKRADVGTYHKLIDPVTIYGQSLDDVWPGDEPAIVKLLKWGVTLRDFCDANNLTVRPTLGSMAGQFLTDSRFYPKPRRKVPAKINERVRENLPGNHYVLKVFPDPSNDFTAHYLDQHRAHHYHAKNTPLPDSDNCYAYGRFIDLDGESFRSTVENFYGLYCLDLVPPKWRSHFDWVGDNLSAQFIYSNELPHLLDSGYRVSCVRAAWGSLKRDTGIPKYARWCEEQLDHYCDAPWLKPLLLATYGVLATRPASRESVFRLAKRGIPVSLRTGRSRLNGLHVASPRKLEPPIAHLLQRGMIEAATRSDSIGLAEWLDGQGHHVLSIYADAVMVRAHDDKPLPTIPDPWRLKRTLTHLQFINQQAFTSDGMTKLPGVGREFLKYRQERPGYAPRIMEYSQYTAVTNRPVESSKTFRRI